MIRRFLLLLLLASGAGAGEAAPLIVLKLDDLNAAPYARGGFERVFRVLQKRNVAASFGVITNSCAGDGASRDYFAQLRRWAESGKVELWHHGWAHQRGEFQGSGLDAQRRRLRDGWTAVKQATGVEMATFGAPFGEVDADTITALREMPEIRIWFGPREAASMGMPVVLHQRATMEAKVGVVSYELFVDSFERQRGADYLVVLGHPPYWDDASHRAFDRVVQFCLAQGCRFATAAEAVRLLRTQAVE
ncbi:MAG TPA: polysaccharide deacetylase family protein [Acidobacteriota bacterium]|nr:polysaccharide deacetylase family protein [Acidobacteriota bacterium]